jgi:type II secretory ATPase GspE/PulE/Tfp pilus assembly ATPase PilB-like protein
MDSRPEEDAQELVSRVLRNAVESGASDIYWIPGPSEVKVHSRIDGIPQDVTEICRKLGERCIARVKVLSGLLTYRTHIPQDGVIRDLEEMNGAEIRVAVMPTSHGERVCMRILRDRRGPQYLEELGFTPERVKMLRTMLHRPSGMIVLTGPTGSGKTTTIYALVRELLRAQQDPASIITIEDPIECEIDGISQTHVSGEAEWDYASALRASLRQDVKTIVVGEMRDREVVKVTLDAALTGHRVITTYHAGDIPSVYARLLHQGFEPFLVASAITGVVAQRLVPRAEGKGRIPVLATLRPTDEWRDFVTGNPGLAGLRKAIRRFPAADLQALARAMQRSGLIAETSAKLVDLDIQE